MMNLRLFSPRFNAGFTLAFMLCAFTAFGQYPAQPNKIALGRQTTGDGLIFRTSGTPSWSPTTALNAWMAIDTTNGNMWTYREGEWFLEVAGDLKVDYPKVINKSGVNILRGQVVMVDTAQLVQGDQVRIRPAIGTMSNSQFVMGVASEDIPNDSSSYVTWFGYVREVNHADIAQTGVTLDVGDILYISATQAGKYTDTEPAAPNVNSTMALVVRKPNANNMTLLVRPWLNEKLGDLRDVDLAGIANGQGISWDSVNQKFIPATFGSGSVTSIATNNGITGGTITTSGTIGLTGQALALHNVGGTGFFTRGAGGSIALRSIDAGTGISISDASGLSGNPTITNSAPDQTVVLTAGTGISTSGTYPNFTITNSAPDQTVSIAGAGINAVTGTYPNFTITATEVDGSTTNEGVLGVGAGSANTAVINSNTSGATGVTINGGVGALVTETTSSNGGTINVLVDTANIVSKTFLTNQGYTSNAGTVTSVATGYGLDGGTITTTGTLSVDTLEIATPYDVSLKQDKLSGTGLVKSTSGTISYITDNSANWDAAYNDRITSATFSGSGTKTLSLSQQDGGAVTASFTDLQGVTSITAGTGLTGGTITTSGTIDADTTTVLASKTWVQTRGYLTSEVDGSVSNEGVLGVGAGGDNTSVITSNTSGANGVTVSGGVGVSISESTSSKGGTITARIDTANIVTKTFLSNQAYTSNTGTVTSIATNNGITGGTITTTGTIGLTGNALGLHQLASNGMLARTGAGAIAARTITAGTGITVSNGDGVGGNPTITNSAPDQTVSITGAGINAVSGTYPNFTVTGTEVDGSTTNEGTLGVGAGGANTAIITSNTSGASGVTIAGGTNVTITESTSSNGGTITVNASGGDSGWFKFFNQYTTPTVSKPMKFSGSDSLYVFANLFSDTNYLAMTPAYLSDSIDATTKRYDLVLDIDMSLVSSVARLADSTAALRAAFPTGTVKGTGAANKVAIWASADSLYQNTNLHWDNTNGRLGIGTSAPSSILDVSNIIRVGGPLAPTFPTTGAGFEVGYDADGRVGGASGGSGVSVFQSYSRDSLLWKELWLRGFEIGFDNAGARAMIIKNGGNVGIGTVTPANRLDVEGGAAIGASYSGTNTAPTNGLLVEGVFGLGTNILTSGFQMHMYGRKKTELIESNNTTTNKGHEYSNSQTFTTLNTTFNNNFNRTLNSVVMSGNSTVKANNFGEILQTSYTLSDTANLIYGTNMSIKAKILRQNSNRGLVNKLRYITFDTLDTQGTGTPNINIKRFEGLAIENLTTAPSGITTDTVMAIYIAQQKGGSTSAAYSIYSEGGTMYHEGAIQTKGTLSRSTFQTVTGATANIGTDATWVICNRAGTINLTLPSASANPGRELIIKTITANAVNSAVGVNNVVPIDSDVAGNTILPATDGAWALLVSNGTNWVIMQRGS